MKLRHSSSALAMLLCAGCFAGSSNDPFQTTTGSFDITLTTPPGVIAKVTLHGPDKFIKEATASVKLEGLLPGDYYFEAPAVILPTSIIDTVYSVDLPAAPFKLGSGQALKVTLTYAQRPGTGSIWLTRFGDARLLGGWLAQSLLQGANPAADARVLTSYEDMLALQLDPAGDLWLLAQDVGLETFVVFSWKDLLPGESQPAPRTVQAGERLSSFTFDAAGGVWCVTRNGYLVHYSSAQLAAGDLTQADVTLHGAAGSLVNPVALAFDTVGNLWVVDAGGPGSLKRFSPRQFATSSFALPTATLSVASPSALQFDATGNAWVASQGKLVRFDAAQLGMSGATPPAGTLDFGNVQIHSWAFDALGELWTTYTDATSHATSLGMLTSSQIATSGVVAPFVPLVTPPNRGAPSLLLVDPPPAGSPLYGRPQ